MPRLPYSPHLPHLLNASPPQKELLDLLRGGFRILVCDVLGGEEDYEQIESALDTYVDYLKLSEYRCAHHPRHTLAVLGMCLP